MNQADSTETNNSEISHIKRFFTVRNFAKRNRAQGCWPDSYTSVWGLRAGSPDNGFGKAFVTVGRRVLIDEEKFLEAIDRLQEVKNASSK